MKKHLDWKRIVMTIPTCVVSIPWLILAAIFARNELREYYYHVGPARWTDDN